MSSGSGAAGGGPLSIRNPELLLEDEIAKLIREIKAYDEKVKANPIQPGSQNTNPYEEEMELQGEWQRLYELVQNLLHDEPERHDALMALLEPYAVRFGEPSQSQGGGRRKARKSKSRKSRKSKSKSKSKKSKSRKSKGRK
jgi:hypothetical protein